ncbi:MAG TPA: cytochrome P450 [Actinocrinis sp.]|uniref:cytochrome P450 n=1 Tax=Actinocrinis sp. TaxID=1920516 RepID=UPI002D69943B|nr:cytochrome P450 [Actinocrinis sp.]HZU56431.1 cytochrome P450 [Actinocrinis sp.]
MPTPHDADTAAEVFPLPGSSYRGPAPQYAKMRARCPVTRVPSDGGADTWVVTGYEQARALSADPRLSRAAACAPGAAHVGGTMFTPPDMIISLDDPEHARLRKLVVRAFTARRVEELRPRVQQMSDTLLDAVAAGGAPADLVESYTLPLPSAVIGELLGVPSEDLADFARWARAFATVGGDGQAAQEGLAKLSEYIVGLIARKRAEPGQDMLSALIAARDQQDRLSEAELVTFGFTLIGAGFDTTASHLANSVLTLVADHPQWWRWLAEDRSRVPAAVEELLRAVNLFATDTTGFPRVATADIEVAGETIREGEPVMIVLSAANRDPAVFDDPDRLDLARTPNPHIAFGHGIHHCLGMQLARIELQIALDGLLRRFPDLRLAVPESELEWHTGEVNHTLVALPVAWGN